VAAVERLMDDPGLLTRRLVRDARAQAAERFSVARYRKDLVSVLSALPAPTAPYRPAHRL
ncbi:MAG TPA: hypothetical protein VLW53_18610, partial [Candidatus Eisenbacteria bacterium]|nr:hypothetical protein [Candidatus Eisenbacteria bacterium]